MLLAVTAALVMGTTCVASAAPDPRPVKDIFDTPNRYGDGQPALSNLSGVGNLLFFYAKDRTHGNELWKSDGTTAGTMLVKDIIPGAGSSNVENEFAYLTSIGSTLYFVTNDGIHGKELWKSDGTAWGTEMVKDIAEGLNSSTPHSLTVVGTTLFFITVNNGAGKPALWKSDGTSEGTVQVKEIGGDRLTAVGSTLFFKATKGNGGVGLGELWKSDGTEAGTVIVREIAPGSSESGPDQLTAMGSQLYFTANDRVHGKELWRTDGTAANTFMIRDFKQSSAYSYPQGLTVVGTELFFWADDDRRYYGWKTDGTPVGTTRLLTNNNEGQYLSEKRAVIGSTMYYQAYDNANGYELWRTNGTNAGTFLVKDIYPGTIGSNIDNMTVVGSTLFFTAHGGLNEYGLWKSDGTSSGTVLVKSGSAGRLTAFGSTLYFSAQVEISGHHHLWKSDGTAAGTVLVKEMRGTGDSINTDTNAQYAKIDGNLFFRAVDGIHGPELWKTDGTAIGTAMVKDIRPSPNPTNSSTDGSYPSNLTTVGSNLFFTANDGIDGIELWKSNGTEQGTIKIKDIRPGDSYPEFLTVIGSTVFFSAYVENGGKELWKSDGTEAGTLMVKKIGTGTAGSYPQNLTVVGSVLFFSATDGINGTELWKSDGTPEGTVMVKDIAPGTGSSSPGFLKAVGNSLFFMAWDASGAELWKSDGTAAGTFMVKDINPGPGYSGPIYPTLIGATLFFIANNGVNGYELWKSDGTESGTQMVKDINPGAGSSRLSSVPSYFGVLGTTLFFTANDGVNGDELWKSDGTEDGTVIVKDINDGAGASNPSFFKVIGATLFFSATDGSNGVELWKTDGTAAGTLMVADLTGDGASSDPGNMTEMDGKLFFAATSESTGRELYIHDPALPNPPSVSESAIPSTTASQAGIFGFVNPNAAPTTIFVDYGLTSSYGQTATVPFSPETDFQFQPANIVISGLLPAKTYHYRIRAYNEFGITYTPDRTFTTEDGKVPPVLFIPGIAGSVLTGPDTSNPQAVEQLWPTIGEEDVAALNLNLNTPGIRAVDIVRTYPPLPFGIGEVIVYEPLMNYFTQTLGLREFPLAGDPNRLTNSFMADQNYTIVEKPNLFTFPYDWRQDNRTHRSTLRAYITNIRNLHGGAKVNVVAHSMGGLILRDYVLHYPEDINKAVTVGTPIWGAPKAVYRLLTGEFYDSPVDWITSDEMKTSLASMPSTAQLIPPFQPGHISSRVKLLSESNWDLNGKGGAFENYPPAVFWEYVNSIAPGFRQFNEGLHTASMGNWAGDTNGIRWLHICGSVERNGEATTTDSVQVYEKTTTIRGITSRFSGYRENKGPGDNVVPYASAGRSAQYLAPNSEVFPYFSNEGVPEGKNVAEHTEMTKSPAVHAKIAQFLGLTAGEPPAPSPIPQSAPSVGEKRMLTVYGSSYVPVRDAAGNENTRLSPGTCKKVPGFDIQYDGISNSMKVDSNLAAEYALQSPSATQTLEAEMLSYNAAGTPQSLRRFRFAPQAQAWKLGMMSGGPVLEVDANRNGTFEPTEVVPPTHAIDGDQIETNPPTITMTLSLNNETATLTMTANDDSPNPVIRYQRNDDPVAVYSGPLSFPFRDGQRVKAYAEDIMGNSSGLIETTISPKLGISSPQQNQVHLEWPRADAYLLEEATSPAGPYAPVGGVISKDEFRESVSIPIGSDPKRFFRLRTRNVTK